VIRPQSLKNGYAKGSLGSKLELATQQSKTIVMSYERSAEALAMDDIAIMVDYSQPLSVEEAVKRMAVLALDFIGHAEITITAETPIQSGENWWGPLAIQQAIAANASDLIMPDAMKIGGVSGWLEACDLGEQHKIPLSTHLWPELNAQLLCLAPTAHRLEYNNWWSAVIADPLQIRDGKTVIDGFRGSGIDWNETAISRYTA
jgi:mandelate racemase